MMFKPTSARIFRLIGAAVARMLGATAITAVIGAVANGVNERIFDQDAYNAGPALGRALFAFTLTSPFILVGLLLIGLPTDYALRRFQFYNAFAFGFSGAAAGLACGAILVDGLSESLVIFAGYGCVSALAWWALRPSKPYGPAPSC